MKDLSNINGEWAGLLQEFELMNSEAEKLNLKLAELTKEMNQFTYIVSHDLQAPLRMITGFLELLERRYGDKLDDAAKQYIAHAVQGAATMKERVFDLLEYSRLSSVAAVPAPVDLNEIMDEVKEKLLPALEKTGAIVTADRLPVITGCRERLAQLLYHLIENALKFRSGAVPEINIMAKKENASWVIGIRDNGIGIDPAFFEKIFIIFKKLHSDEANYGGTGTGLAVCKKIAEMHGGAIWVESGVGKGSTFWFSIPVS